MNQEIQNLLKKIYHEKPLARKLVENYIRNLNVNSKNRRKIADFIYDSIRFIGFVKENGFYITEEQLNEIKQQNFDYNQESLTYYFGFHPEIAKKIINSINKSLFITLLHRAPLTIRTNMLKTTRDKLLLEFSKKFKKFSFIPTAFSPYGIIIDKHINVRALDNFKKGLFEIQDEASQLTTFLLPLKPNQTVLDICAGTGGKSFALASHFYNSINIDAFDIDKKRLNVLKKRAKISEAKINITKTLKANHYDAVIIDAPCSGLGTLRRDVDLNIRTTPSSLQKKIELQRKIFSSAIKSAKKGGLILYITCSFLIDENENQVDYFLNSHKNLKLLNLFDTTEKPVSSLIQNGFYKTNPMFENMDFFFAALFQKL